MFHFIMPTLFLNIEKWKWNSEYLVYVSNRGHFKNEHKQNLPFKMVGKYLAIMTPNGRQLAHRLVCMTWKPIPNAENMTVDHLNHNTRDNSLENLEWVTKEENLERAKNDYILPAEAGIKGYSDLFYGTKKERKIKNKEIYYTLFHSRLMKATKRTVKCGETVYSSLIEAVLNENVMNTYLLKDLNISKNLRNKINGAISKSAKKAQKAIENNTLYCGKKWSYVDAKSC